MQLPNAVVGSPEYLIPSLVPHVYCALYLILHLHYDQTSTIYNVIPSSL